MDDFFFAVVKISRWTNISFPMVIYHHISMHFGGQISLKPGNGKQKTHIPIYKLCIRREAKYILIYSILGCQGNEIL